MFELLQLLHNHDDSGRLLMMMSTANSAESHYSPLATFGFGSVLGIPLLLKSLRRHLKPGLMRIPLCT